MEALDKDVNRGKVLIAGKYWRETNEKDPKIAAQELGFGMLFENGDDLIIVQG
jgi:hypothetical protein